MKITGIQTFLMHAGNPDSSGWRARNGLFIKIHTDEGVHGVGEGSGWPRVVEGATAHYPSTGNIAPPAMPEYTYFRAREERAAWLQSGRPRRTEDFV